MCVWLYLLAEQYHVSSFVGEFQVSLQIDCQSCVLTHCCCCFLKSFQLVSLTFYAAVFMFFFISDLVRCMNTFLELVYHCSDIFCGFLSRCDFVFICWYDDIWLFPLWRYSYFFNWNLPVVIIVLVKNNHLFHLLIEFSTMRGTYSLFGIDLLKLKTFKILKAI